MVHAGAEASVFPAGEAELRTDSEWLAKIRFEATKSK
jgi:hypothetical protein